MSDSPSPTDALPEGVVPTPWQSLPEAARQSFRLAWGLLGLVIGIGAGVLPAIINAFRDGPSLEQGIWAIGWLLLSLGFCLWQASLRWRHTQWRLDGDGLHVRRGRFWFSEVLIPRARVQHLDLERGPIERRYGLATLVVHTAGTRLSALRQPGFDAEDATRLRDALVPALREHDDHG